MDKTKYLLLVGDGMADYPLDELAGKTPLEAARTPNMDRIATCRVGLVKTIPDGMKPGSDVANLSILGYDPAKYNTGRGPFEAASMGITLEGDQVAFRMNLVTLDWRSDDKIIMISHSSGDLPSNEATGIVESLNQGLHLPGITIYQGVGYRHLLLWENGPVDALTIPPHDVLGQNMATYLNHSSNNPVTGLIRSSWQTLRGHPANKERSRGGLMEANSIWPWGQGKVPKLPLFGDRFGLKGGAISAVDLIKGIGIFAGFTPIRVEGATGYLNTNYLGKARAALEGLQTLDFIFLHLEAPDEAGHSGDYKEKIEAIENFDEKVVGTVLEGLKDYEDYRVMVISDHYTPVILRTHTDEPAPFAWGTKEELESPTKGTPFTEASARKSGLLIEDGYKLMELFLKIA